MLSSVQDCSSQLASLLFQLSGMFLKRLPCDFHSAFVVRMLRARTLGNVAVAAGRTRSKSALWDAGATCERIYRVISIEDIFHWGGKESKAGVA